MTGRRCVLALGAAMLTLVLAGCGANSIGSLQLQRLDAIRRATEMYVDPNVALARGYFQLPGCIASSDGSGALGTHFIKVTDLNRRTVDLLRPQALYYDLNPAHGSKQLLGVGYFVPDVGQRPPDTPIGHMEGPLPATPQQPSHFQLNAWIYRRNPTGVLSFWNKNVTC